MSQPDTERQEGQPFFHRDAPAAFVKFANELEEVTGPLRELGYTKEEALLVVLANQVTNMAVRLGNIEWELERANNDLEVGEEWKDDSPESN